MARALPAWVGKTDDTAIPPRVRLRVWDRQGEKCHRCQRKIPASDAWIIEHRHAIILGGANAEHNLCLSCSWCKPVKDAEDVAEKAASARVRQKHLGIRPEPTLRSAGFAPRQKQQSATRPLTKRVGYFPEVDNV